MLYLRPLTAALLLLSLAPAALAGPREKPIDAAGTIKHVLPAKDELVWTHVPWKPTLWAAVIEAQKEKKPILLWAMNGHALACT